MNDITKKLLSMISDISGEIKGAFNIREDGGCAGRQSTENVDIIPKVGQPGIDIIIKPGTHETVYIPACVTRAMWMTWYTTISTSEKIPTSSSSRAAASMWMGRRIPSTTASTASSSPKTPGCAMRKSTSALEKAPASALSTRRPTSRWRRTATWRWTPSRSRA